MSYKLSVRNNALGLRKKGFSLTEISNHLDISKSTASLWTSREKITKLGKKRILLRQIAARSKATSTIKKQRKDTLQKILNMTDGTLKNIEITNYISKLLCSIFIWTEGGKSAKSRVVFVNSDPKMIGVFLFLFRKSFPVKETKLRSLVHIHEYHNKAEILDFWSKITKIPLNQFTKSYLKPHTKKRIREGYKGSVRISYCDYKIAWEITSIYNMFADNLLGL